MSIKLGINGFGRIGRMVLRAALKHPDVDVVAINDLTDSETMAYLLKYDSVHGQLDMDITAHNDSIEIDGKSITIRSVKDPEKIGWSDLGVDIAAECTGIFRDREGASKHLTSGARKVIISAPAGDPDITIVMGVNSSQYDPRQHNIISNASCTTNCLAPVAKVLLENFGLSSGLMTTIHSYTGDQRLLDFPHKDLRRARAAALSMIPTTTGAAKAVALVLPELSGKLNGLAIRVPTPNVSLVDLVFTAAKDLTAEEVNAAMKLGSGQLPAGVLAYNDKPLVSVDFNHNPASSIFDATQTRVSGRMVKIMAWYDNEWGFSNRMIDVARLLV